MLVVVAALAGLISGWWICDLFGQLKIAFVIALLVCALILNVLNSHKIARIAAFALIILSVPLVQLNFGAPAQKPAASGLNRFTVLSFNTECQSNTRFDLFEKLVQKLNPDVLVFVEIDAAWQQKLEAMRLLYPYQRAVLEGPGMIVCSRHPIENFKVQHFGKSNHPRLHFDLRSDSTVVNVVAMHPTTPKSEAGFLERNAEMALVADEMAAMSGAKMLVGDLNCAPWADAFSKLLQSGLRDTEQGFGAQPTWPARTGRVIPYVPIPPLVPIDHVLVGGDIKVIRREVGQAINSDHLPVFVELEIGKSR